MRCPKCNTEIDPYRTSAERDVSKTPQIKASCLTSWSEHMKKAFEKKRIEEMATRLVEAIQNLVWTLVFVSVLASAGWTGYKIINSDSRIQFCYIKQRDISISVNDNSILDCSMNSCKKGDYKIETFYELFASVNWRQDYLIGTYRTFDDTQAIANKMQCPIQ